MYIVHFVIKGSVTLKRTEINEETVRKARVKSEMVAALGACQLLHEKGELNEDLQPVLRYIYFKVHMAQFFFYLDMCKTQLQRSNWV